VIEISTLTLIITVAVQLDFTQCLIKTQIRHAKNTFPRQFLSPPSCKGWERLLS